MQTVIRRFGSKEGLLDAMHERLGAEIRNRRSVEPGDLRGAVRSSEDYEQIGELILRTLAQEIATRHQGDDRHRSRHAPRVDGSGIRSMA